jgi:hypothetical protein
MLLMLTTWVGSVYSKLSNPLPAIEAFCSRFFYAIGDQFFIKDVNYQAGVTSSTSTDLANVAQCKLEAPLMKELG